MTNKQGRVRHFTVDDRFNTDWHWIAIAMTITVTTLFTALRINQDITYTAPAYEITQEIPCTTS